MLRDITLREDRFGFEPEITAKIARGRVAHLRGADLATTGAPTTEGKKITWKDGIRGVWCTVRYGLFR